MPYGHLIAATVMTLGVCQGHSLFASFSILTSALRAPSAIAELLVIICIWPNSKNPLFRTALIYSLRYCLFDKH